jgi:hypothetical protein
MTRLMRRCSSAGTGSPRSWRACWPRPAEAPGEAHLLISEILQAAAGHPSRLVLIIDQFEQVFAAPDELEWASFIDAVCAAATGPAGRRGEPTALAVIAVRGDY